MPRSPTNSRIQCYKIDVAIDMVIATRAIILFSSYPDRDRLLITCRSAAIII